MADKVYISFGVEKEAEIGQGASKVNQKGRITYTEKNIYLGLGNSHITYDGDVTGDLVNWDGTVAALPPIDGNTRLHTMVFNEATGMLHVVEKNAVSQALEWKEIPIKSGFDYVSDQKPVSPDQGAIWIDKSTGMIYVYKEVMGPDGQGTGQYEWQLPKDTNNVVPDTSNFVTQADFQNALEFVGIDALATP